MAPPVGKVLSIDRSTTFQTMLGFGGAFTEASALNWRTLTPADQAEVIRLYFSSEGLAYTVGRVPINSCDFGPGDATRFYNFDNVTNDVDLKYFDDSVSHDVTSGMIPMIKDAQAAINTAGGTLRLHELLAPFGLDAREPSFWRQGLGLLESFIDELETL